jgi:Spy/CpxP family protein refolding chaperone
MKKQFLTALFFVATITGVFAQKNPNGLGNNQPGKQKIKTLYIAFITQELNLTETEAEKFWPIHHQYNEDLMASNKAVQNVLEKEEANLNTKKKYNDKFIKVLGAEKTNLFFIKDNEFRKKMVEKLKKQRLKKMEERKGKGKF